MTIEQIASLLKVVIELIQTLVWPGIMFFILVRFESPVRKFIENLSELSFKGAGMEATAKRQQIEVAAMLGAAAQKASPSTEANEQEPNEKARQVAKIVSQVTPRVAQRLGKTSVLWVDDNPSNNVYERRTLEALGINIILSKSTEEALRKISESHFDIIISDMNRPPDSQAGFTLLAELPKQAKHIPFVIYAGSNAPKYQTEAISRGAFGITNNPNELVQLVLAAQERKEFLT